MAGNFVMDKAELSGGDALATATFGLAVAGVAAMAAESPPAVKYSPLGRVSSSRLASAIPAAAMLIRPLLSSPARPTGLLLRSGPMKPELPRRVFCSHSLLVDAL